MFERFTTSARQAVVAAQGEARRLGHGYVGTEHLLLGLLSVDDGIAADVLRDTGIDATMVEGDVVRIVGRGPGGPPAGVEVDAEADALRVLGIDLDAVREAAEAAFGPGALERARPTEDLRPARSSREWPSRRWPSRRWPTRQRTSRQRTSRRRSCRAPLALALGRSRLFDVENPPPLGSGRVPFTPRAKKVLELSLREALALRHGHIGTEHVLLGLIREGEGLAAEVLVLHGVGLDDLRRRVLSALDDAA